MAPLAAEGSELGAVLISFSMIVDFLLTISVNSSNIY